MSTSRVTITASAVRRGDILHGAVADWVVSDVRQACDRPAVDIICHGPHGEFALPYSATTRVRVTR